MKIGFDARFLVGQKPGGVGIYIFNLIKFLTKRNVECVLFYDFYRPYYKQVVDDDLCDRKIKLVKIPIKSRANIREVLFWEQVLLPQAIKKEKIELYHATENRGIPMTIDVPSVLTVHDVIPFLISFSTRKTRHDFRVYYEASSKISFEKADKIICISNSTKNDLLGKFKIDSKKIKIIHNGIDINQIKKYKYDEREVEKFLRERHFEMKNYFISMGGVNPRKNLERLIKAYSLVKKQGYQIKLLIVGFFDKGSSRSYYLKLKRLIDSLRLTNEVIFSGYIPSSEKYKFLAGAKALVYPSLMEGFGLPILEAELFKIPIIASDIPAFSEIGGKAIIKIDPYNINEISQALIKVLEDNILVEKLTKIGSKQVKNFSFDKIGKETFKIYQMLLRA